MGMIFMNFRNALRQHFDNMCGRSARLFVMDVDKDKMWETYLSAFPEGTNPIFKTKTWHDCSCCRHFIKALSNVVAIHDGEIETIWDFDTKNDPTYEPVRVAMREFVLAGKVSGVYISSERAIGCEVNRSVNDDGHINEFFHFRVDIPNTFYSASNVHKNEIISESRSGKEVFLRALREIDLEALNVVLDLISENSLYKGPEYRKTLEGFKREKLQFLSLSDEKAEDIFAWERSVIVSPAVRHIKNSAIGTLLMDISGGMELDEAVRRYETITAPSNYKRSKPIFSKKQLEDTKKTITELGFSDSLERRFAKESDVTINDILFVDADTARELKEPVDIFDTLSKMAEGGHKENFDRVEEISPDAFVDILKSASGAEVYVENSHSNNLVSLIAPKNSDSKSLFKWGNSFSWAYTGNLTDSMMKERVKEFGGKVDGDLRFSIQWNESGEDNCDLDAHCLEPMKYGCCYEIYFGSAKKPNFSPTKGQLDVDIIEPNGQVAVENITWETRDTMVSGSYRFFVHVYSGQAKHGFRAEIEFDGNIYSFDYPNSMCYHQRVDIADVIYDHKTRKFTLKPLLPESHQTKTMWGVKTNNFVPVSLICYSPNHWSTADVKSGHKHLFFMLKGCMSDETPSGMFNEYLCDELYSHRRVMEALSGQMRVEPSDNQLSGLGFALDKRGEVVVRVTKYDGSKRVYKIKF